MLEAAATAPGIRKPAPLATAPSIPPGIVGRIGIFLFGTLMDADVLAHVLRRPVEPGTRLAARLKGFRRVRTRAASYPVLVPAPGATVAGLLLRHFTRGDLLRINHLESEEYGAELHAVTLADGTRVPAWLYVGLSVAHMRAGAEPWELASWQRRHKAAYLLACDRWLEDCPATEDAVATP